MIRLEWSLRDGMLLASNLISRVSSGGYRICQRGGADHITGVSRGRAHGGGWG